MAAQDQHAVEVALELAREYTPAVYDAVMSRFDEVAFGPHLCGQGVVACVHPESPGCLVFKSLPSAVDAVELAAAICVAATWLRPDGEGGYAVFEHAAHREASGRVYERYRDVLTQHIVARLARAALHEVG